MAERRSRSRKSKRPGVQAGGVVSQECARLLALVRERCPGLLPPNPLPHGNVGPELAFQKDEVQRLVTAAAGEGSAGGVAVWTKGDCELLVITGKVTVQLDQGLVLITIPTQCAEAGTAQIQVAFAVGDDKHPSGMFAATEERPRGPALVVDVWGEALIAFAWRVLMSAASGVAAGAGTDASGAGLIPAALNVNADGLRVITMARFPFDRIKR